MCVKDEICVICGKVFPDSVSDYEYGDFYCNECFDKKFKECKTCGYVYEIEDIFEGNCRSCENKIGLSVSTEKQYKFKTL